MKLPLSAPTSGGHRLLSSFLAGFREAPHIALRLALWGGSQHDLGRAPLVTVRLSAIGAMRYFVPPSLDNLGDGCVSGRFDVEGRAQDIVEVVSQLAHHSLPRRGRFGRLLSLGQHDRASDDRAIEHHYDVSNDFYRLRLGEALVYSCGYFPNGTETLAEAQNAKLDHILAKLMLTPGERLLDIGCGWGALVIRAAQQ